MPDPDGNPAACLSILAVLILCNAFFSLCEAAVIALNDGKLRRMAESGDPAARRILWLVEEPSRFLSTIQAGKTLSSLFASAVAAIGLCAPLARELSALPLPFSLSPRLWYLLSVLLVILLLAFLLEVLGEVVPKRLGTLYPEPVAFCCSRMLKAIYHIARPFVALLNTGAGGILRLIRINPNEEPERVTEEEIRMMVDVGNEKGVIEQSEKDMIDNIFEFDERTAGDVMTHRTELLAVDVEDKLSDIIPKAVEYGFSRLPVYEESIDNVVGILYVKDILPFIGRMDYDSVPLRSLMREAMYVPETNSCQQLLHAFKESKVQMAIVVDEYGGTSGVATMEDLLESIVGNIQDEYDNEEELVQKVCDGLYNFDGSVPLDEVGKLMGLEFPDDAGDTLSGMLIDQLGRIPGEREHPRVRVQDVVFSVLKVADRRIAKVQAERIPPKVEQPAPEKDAGRGRDQQQKE